MNTNQIVATLGNFSLFRVECQRQADGYINITLVTREYTKATGKRRDCDQWLSNKRTKEDIEHLSLNTGIPVFELVQVFQGSPEAGGGTWVHPKLSIRFGIWLSSEFGYAIETWFEDWSKQAGLKALRAELLTEQCLMLEQARAEIKEESQKALTVYITNVERQQEERLNNAIAMHTENILQQVAVQQNNFAIQLWERFSFEFEKEFSKVRQEWLRFYEKYSSQEKELQALKTEFDIFFHGKVEGVAPGWNVDIWRALPKQDRINFWKKHKLEGWMPSDQFQAQYTNILPAAPVEERIINAQRNELKQIMSTPSETERAHIEELKNKAFKNLDENYKPV